MKIMTICLALLPLLFQVSARAALFDSIESVDVLRQQSAAQTKIRAETTPPSVTGESEAKRSPASDAAPTSEVRSAP